jgi:hypothetical protein
VGVPCRREGRGQLLNPEAEAALLCGAPANHRTDCYEILQKFTERKSAWRVSELAVECGVHKMNSNAIQRPHRVTAVYLQNKLCFEIAPDATLAQLAEQLWVLSDRHGGILLSVDVQVDEKPTRTNRLAGARNVTAPIMD